MNQILDTAEASDEVKPEPQHPLLALRQKAKDIVKGIGKAFTPDPPPPCEYRVVGTAGLALGDDMTILATLGWRFLAMTPSGALMARNHVSIVKVSGKVEVYDSDASHDRWYDRYDRNRERREHRESTPPRRTDPGTPITIPEPPEPFEGINLPATPIKALKEVSDG